MDLPPCNSFCRLLAHKLADYYALTHFVDNAVSAVRLYRTPYCRTYVALTFPLRDYVLIIDSPTPLSTIVKTLAAERFEPVAQGNVKIMRRRHLARGDRQVSTGDSAANDSAEVSKATSEVGSQSGTGLVSPTESSLTKDKPSMTREEREAKYKETRERIFKGFESTEAVEMPVTTETVDVNSRNGSRSGKKKQWKNRNNDGSFEVRSQYSLGYNGQQYLPASQEHAADPGSFFNPYIYHQQCSVDPNQAGITTAAYQQGFTNALQAMSEPGFMMGFQHAQMFNSLAANNHSMGHHLAQQTPIDYGLPMPTQPCSPMYPQMPITESNSPTQSSSAMHQQAHTSRPQSQPSNHSWVHPLTQYGMQRSQVPPHITASSSKEQAQGGNGAFQYSDQHYSGSPNPGTQQIHGGPYHPPTFNPQTNPFVPTNPGTHFPMAMQHSPSTEGSQYQQTPMNGSYSGYPSFVPQNPGQPVNYFDPQGMQHFGSLDYSHDRNGNDSRKGTGFGDFRKDSHNGRSISKWNTPANLPQKPPIPEVPNGLPSPSPRATLPYNTRNSGQQVPTFQNGVYGLPIANGR